MCEPEYTHFITTSPATWNVIFLSIDTSTQFLWDRFSIFSGNLENAWFLRLKMATTLVTRTLENSFF